MQVNKTFTAVYNVRSPHKRNASIRVCYKKAPKTVSNMCQALCWYFDHVQVHGKGNKMLIEMRESG